MNQNFNTIVEIMENFLLEAALEKSPVTCCLAVAGPVKFNRVTFTNRDGWSVDGETLAKHFGISKVRIINDFLSVGYGILTLDENRECKLLQVNVRCCQYTLYNKLSLNYRLSTLSVVKKMSVLQ